MTNRLPVPRVLALAASLLIVLALLPRTARAQLSVGGNFGWLFDTEEDRLSLGVDARYDLRNTRWTLNPRFTHFLWSDGFSRNQLDGNALYRWPVTGDGLVSPYMGGGLAIIASSYDTGTQDDSETKAGVNYIAGLTFKTTSRLKPYAHVQYTAALDFGNTFMAFVGANFAIGK